MFGSTEEEIQSLIQKAGKSSGQRNWFMSLLFAPDHHLSAELYSDAGHKLKFLDRNKEAAECYAKAGDEYMLSKCSGYLFFAAEAYTNSYSLVKDRSLITQACDLYCMNNSYSLAATTRKQLLGEEDGEEALESLEFIIMCYGKSGMHMNRQCHVEKKGVLCVKLGRYEEAGGCFQECERPLHAFLAYFLAGNERKMKELDFEDEIAMSFYGGNRARDAVEAIGKYEANHGIREEHKDLFDKVLDRLKPEHDIL